MRIAILQADRDVVDASGQPARFTAAELDEIESSYSRINPAPIVIGHPRHNAPAFGWWERVYRQGNHLFAEVNDRNLNPLFKKALKQRFFRKWSASIFKRDSPSNPAQGQLSLRHVGFLGAASPAFADLFSHPANEFSFSVVSGDEIYSFISDFAMDLNKLKELEEITLADLAIAMGVEESALTDLMKSGEKDEEPEVPAEFTERLNAIKRREAVLTAREREQAKVEFTSFCNGIVAEGRPLPALKEEVVAFMASLPGDALEFGEGKRQNRLDWFKGMLKNLPKQVELEEVAGGKFNFADDSKDPNEIALAAEQYQKSQTALGRTISISQAVKAVKEGKAHAN